ncbi:MAG: C13 family peptidase [Promethearchaeota archaeon]
MDKNKRNKIITIASIVIAFTLIFGFLLVFLVVPPLNVDNRKAIIICGANDFYGYETEEGFDGSPDSDFSGDTGNWIPGGEGEIDINTIDIGIDPGYLYFKPTIGGEINANCTFDWTDLYALEENAYYNITTWVYLNTFDPVVDGLGARIGLHWYNSTDHEVRTDWSENLNNTQGVWTPLSIAGICNNHSTNDIAGLKLTIAFEGIGMTIEDIVKYDLVQVEKWRAVNASNPTNPLPPTPTHLRDSDGFPAQALQVYWKLRNNGYSDDNIFLMLYYENDTNGIDIYLNDGVPNDLVGAVIDVANSSVNATRVKHELNSSIPGSFASTLKPSDQLIVFMTDHGSNQVLPLGNATFHFEADHSYIEELEFYDLIKEITVERMLINVDCCFSGNFLSENASLGNSWYNLPNAVFVSSSSNNPSWYWRNCQNGDGFAGSWFFHIFWEQLGQGESIINAYNIALGFIPYGQGLLLDMVQKPLIQDNLGIASTWAFGGNPKL